MKKIYLILAVIFLVSGCKPLDSQLKDAGQHAVKESLKDPNSAEFRNVRYVSASTKGLNKYQKVGFICGEVNAKNGFGAYGGFQQFEITVGATTKHFVPLFGVEYQTSKPRYVDTYEYREGAENIKKLCSF